MIYARLLKDKVRYDFELISKFFLSVPHNLNPCQMFLATP